MSQRQRTYSNLVNSFISFGIFSIELNKSILNIVITRIAHNILYLYYTIAQ